VRCIRRPVPYPPYGGREDNIFWRRIAEAGERQLEAAGARSLGVKDALPLGEDIVHSVTNPTSKFTAAIHVYGGDLFAAHRSEWDPETLSEQRFDGERARQIFEESQSALRCGSWLTRATGSVDDCFGSKAALTTLKCDFRSSSNSGHHASGPPLPKSAMTGLMHRRKQHLHSITSSARASSEGGTVGRASWLSGR
jgi:hypothetical protein